MDCISNFNDDLTIHDTSGNIVTDSRKVAKADDVIAAFTTANAMLAPLFKMIDERKMDEADTLAALSGTYDQVAELVYIVTGNNYDELMDDFGIDAHELQACFPEIVRAHRLLANRRAS